jgi:protein TonB
MFEVLLESRHVRPPRPVVATAVSAAVHAGLVALIAGGAAVATSSDEMNPLWDHIARFLAPPPREIGAPAERLSFVGLGAEGSARGQRDAEPVRVKEKEPAGDAVVPQQVAPAIRLNDLERLQVAAQALGAYSIIEVDSTAERDPLSAAPLYPKEMLARNIEGSAVMQFVIDSTGLIDMRTITVISATHEEFVRAVRDAMPRMRFRPAMRGLVAVRQLVEQPFKFEIRNPGEVPATVVKKPGRYS